VDGVGEGENGYRREVRLRIRLWAGEWMGWEKVRMGTGVK
jgi:hypothetical protein